jgi:hypothetical protein
MNVPPIRHLVRMFRDTDRDELTEQMSAWMNIVAAEGFSLLSVTHTTEDGFDLRNNIEATCHCVLVIMHRTQP